MTNLDVYDSCKGLWKGVSWKMSLSTWSIHKLETIFSEKLGSMCMLISYSVISLQVKDQECDNGLPAQGYCTPLEAVMDGYGAMVEWWLACENWTRRKICYVPFFHQEPHIKSPGNEPEPPQWADRSNCLSYDTDFTALTEKEREKKEREKSPHYLFI
jgi:hypothetical protein